MDTISELGELAFATRLKRLSERLQKDVSRIYKDLDIRFEARWFSILFALTKRSPMTITTLAHTLRLTHPAVNQLAAEMAGEKLLISSKGRKDERKRFLRLSVKGKKISAVLAPVWDEIRLATSALIEETGHDLLSAIEEIEKRLDRKDMYKRVRERLNPPVTGKLEIVPYRPAWKKNFKSLNYEWLEIYFGVEKEDEKILSDPKKRIIDKGGAIFFARMDKKIVGTCALIRCDNGIFELAKMAVTASARDQGISYRLAQAVILRAKDLGARLLYLQTSPKLTVANRLYRKLGFRKISRSPFDSSRYKRFTFTMRLNLERY